MQRLRAELPLLELSLVEAEQKAQNGYWPGPHYWGAEARRLKLAADAARSRIPARTPP